MKFCPVCKEQRPGGLLRTCSECGDPSRAGDYLSMLGIFAVVLLIGGMFYLGCRISAVPEADHGRESPPAAPERQATPPVESEVQRCQRTVCPASMDARSCRNICVTRCFTGCANRRGAAPESAGERECCAQCGGRYSTTGMAVCE